MSGGDAPIHRYRGYGLNIHSEMWLPEFLPAEHAAQPDITIRLGDPDEPAFALGREAEAYDFTPLPEPAGGFRLRITEVARFHVRGGNEIAVLPDDDANEGLLRLFLIGSAMGMALHQRGLMVMHGATVLTPQGTASIFVGDSGAGKSTLAAALGLAGHAILGDDTMVVSPGPMGFEVWPGSRVFKLWQNSLDHFGEAVGNLTKIENRTDKFFWPNRSHAPDRAAPLTEIIHLATGEPGSEPEFRELDGIHALRLIAENTYRPGYVGLLGRTSEHFRQCASLGARLRVGRLTRPRDLSRLEDGIRLLEAAWEDSGAPRSAGSGRQG